VLLAAIDRDNPLMCPVLCSHHTRLKLLTSLMQQLPDLAVVVALLTAVAVDYRKRMTLD